MTAQGDRIENKLDLIHRKLDRLARNDRIQFIQGENIMALDQDIFDAITEQSTVVDGIIAYIQALVESNVISAAEGQKMLSDIKANSAKLEAALVANTPPVEPPTP